MRLRPIDLASVVHAGLLFVMTELGLRLFSVSRLARWMGVPLSFTDGPAQPTDVRAELFFTPSELRRVNAVRRLSPHLYGTERGCLRRALVMGRLLRKRRPLLRIGVHRNDESLAAHAWIEVAGVPVMSGGYRPFVEAS